MGKYEELIVCSHEIAASTAQLVAASKVRGCGVCVRPGLGALTGCLWPADGDHCAPCR